MSAQIAKMARLLVAALADVKDCEAALAKAEEKKKRLERQSLPDLMKEFDMTSTKLRDGTKVDIYEDLECAITEANQEAALKWLKSNDCGGIIKTVISIEFGRDELEAAEALAAQIRRLTNQPINVSEKVHWQTLKSTIRELREKGVNVPLNLFSIFPFSRAKITPPKK